MGKATWTRAELFSGLEPTASFVEELERLGLLRVVARDPRGEAVYDAEARETLERVLVLVEAGYEPRDIAVIAHKVGLKSPRRRLGRRAPTLLRLEDVARTVGVPSHAARGYWTAGWLEATLIADGGEPLFAPDVLELARALADLATVGLEDEQPRWVALARRLRAVDGGADEDGAAAALVAEAAAFAAQVRAAVDRSRGAVRRWTKRLSVFDKRVERLRRTRAPEVARVKPRTGLRRKARTRSSAR